MILDEIQEAPRGLHSLKYFGEECPQLHVIAAGSLLGVTLGKGESFPVGKVQMMNMYPLDFEEFLWAMGEEAISRTISECDHALLQLLSLRCIEQLRQYYFVGGMPEVVAAYTQNHSVVEVREKQQDILEAYRRDISKHTTAHQSIRIG